MKQLIFLCTFLLFPTANAYAEKAEEYIQTSTLRIPTVYASMGTPLYEVLRTFEQYAHLEGMKALIREYGVFMTPIFQHGLALSCKEKVTGAERKAYLNELRTLEEKKRRVMHHLMNLAMKAVDEDDYETFASLVSLPLEELFTITSKRHKAVHYYKSKRRERIPAMEALAVQMKKKQVRKHRESYADDDDSEARDYELKQHLPSGRSKARESKTGNDDRAQSGAYCDNNPSALKKIGTIFKSMGIDFDPSLLEEYKAHKPPSVEDFR